MREIHVEPIKKKDIYLAGGLLSRQEVEEAIDRVVGQVRCNMKYFGTKFPSSAAKDQTYGIIENIEWTDGFWTGLLWLCYEYTGDGEFRRLAEQNVSSFLNRVEKRIELDHHDLGFLYSLSCVAGYKLTGSEEGKRAGLLAADKFPRFRSDFVWQAPETAPAADGWSFRSSRYVPAWPLRELTVSWAWHG